MAGPLVWPIGAKFLSWTNNAGLLLTGEFRLQSSPTVNVIAGVRTVTNKRLNASANLERPVQNRPFGFLVSRKDTKEQKGTRENLKKAQEKTREDDFGSGSDSDR
jgi:hypothetical protein